MPGVDEESVALVALMRLGQRPAEQMRLIEEHGSALAALERHWGANLAQSRLFEEEGEVKVFTDRAAADVARWKREGIQLLTAFDEDYPKNLRTVSDRPPLLFATGKLAQGDARAVAVIGARNSTPRGRSLAGSVAASLVGAGYTVISGLAAGIDTAAHTSALARGGRTIAVLGNGLKRFYPAQNEALQRRIARECAVVSQFWPEDPPLRRSFPVRNALMSGMTVATVIVEATRMSGTRTQARAALSQGRPVLLLSSLLNQNWARELAGRPGTHVVDAPEEVPNLVQALTSRGGSGVAAA